MAEIIREKSAGAVIYRKERSGVLYLLIKPNAEQPYGFPKGKTEEGEDDIMTAKREVFEETGLTVGTFHDDFSHEIHYVYGLTCGSTVKKSVVYFLAEVKDNKIKLSDEHICYIWVNYAKAKELLKYANLRRILEKVEKKLL